MSSNLSVKIDVKVQPCRKIDAKVQLFNNASIDYYIESRSFVDLDDRLGVSGVSDVPCKLIRELEPEGYNPVPLKIPAGGHLDSEYLHLSNSCDFSKAVLGRYFVVYSTSLFVYTDENLSLYNTPYELIGGSTSFNLVDNC